MIIGVISDTHNLLRPEVFEVFSRVDRIIHAGDIGTADILTELEALAPVHAVYGNTDRFPLVERLKDRELLIFGDTRIFVTHIGGKPSEMRRFYPEIAYCNIVIFGHSHRPQHLVEDQIIFFNPGSAGPRRFSLPVTVGTIEIHNGAIDARIIELRA
ncbi:MAG TPA: metallophosphoesterase family protein [Acidobacteriota bacterium]|nr:metallophosphoesterase family protein [Acidobacteriota bacterium]